MTLNLVLPVGISYYVFQNLSYVIDVYRRDLVATRGVVEYATALSFFPQLLAGPITRPRDLLPQLFERRAFDDERARDGLRQVLWGLTKKMLIADNIGVQVDYVWANIGSVRRRHARRLRRPLLRADLLRLLGLRRHRHRHRQALQPAPLEELRLPLLLDVGAHVLATLAHHPGELDARLRLHPARRQPGRSAPRRDFNVLVTFLLVGLWHGANWTFVVWGGLHGTYLVVGNRTALSRSPRAQRKPGSGRRCSPPSSCSRS